ncbi:hypothetical protein BCR32DRAFT_269124 [Anaeromyces robustus]|uniref:Uncharacterized protein n=1 Tax=Anaeromyces robustus TaxID=1754192 RepID=A0A1Y1X304_9FUNG|nr:hypothetical protein BCR32DRAFT_269124 [Anaeromyces robustus]|eukprot:ORX80008.1 hypothetical protein BCR32DRAFT_269124 [Anaeromyces robustus]
MQDQSNVKRSILQPAPPTSSPNTSKYISPKTTKILNSSNNNNNTRSNASNRYLSRGTTDTESYSSLTSSTSSLDKPRLPKEDSIECLFEIQGLEPSPGTTYHQIVVYAPLENPKSRAQIERKNGAVVLREWPRLRYSQKYSRDAGPNPAEIKHSYEEFLEIVDELPKEKSEMDIKKEKLCAIKECSSKKSDQQKLDWVSNNQTYIANTRDKIIHIFGEDKFREIVACTKKGMAMNNGTYNDDEDQNDY